MTEESRYLLDLAGRVGHAYTRHPGARAAMVAGSVAERHSDTFSDIDMMVYYETLPTDEALEAARTENGGTRLWQAGDRNAGALMEAYHAAGVECQIVHVTIAAWSM